jgi:hypothetical protein
MRKIIVLLGILALVIGTGGLAKVCAGPYGPNRTINDNASRDLTGWWGQQEDQETEYNPLIPQGTMTGQGWDWEAFQQQGATLSIIGGFNFATGVVHEPGQAQYTERLGALFLKTGAAPNFGAGNFVGTASQMDNDLWGYNYAITFDFGIGTTPVRQYTLWAAIPGTGVPGTGSQDMAHGVDGGAVGNVSNPWTIVKDTWTALGTFGFTYQTGLSDGMVSTVGDPLTGGSHNVISGIDLSFLNTVPGMNPITYLHLTYECGNDNLMGQIPANSVPVPASVLLLGTGLLGLVGLRRFSKK